MKELSDLVREHLPLVVGVSLMGITALGMGIRHYANKANRERVPGSIPVVREEEKAYTPRTIEKAFSAENGSIVKGTIEEFHIAGGTYSWIVSDNGESIPFIIGEDQNSFDEVDKGLLPLMLSHSMKNKTPLEMFVCVHEDYNDILVVNGITGKIGAEEYRLGESNEEE